jgi:tetratricopeptide (TPR) repeat protein
MNVSRLLIVAAGLGLGSLCGQDQGKPLHAIVTLLRAEQYPQAEALLRSAVAEDPQAASAWYLLGYALFREGRAKESLDAYAHGAALRPPAADDLKVVGLDYGLLGDYDGGIRYLKSALEIDPANLEARYYLGRIYYTQNKFAEAERTFREVLARDAGHVKAYNNLGQTLEALNDRDGAIAAYRRAIELDRASPKRSEYPYLNLAALLADADDVEPAAALLLEAQSINPQNAKVHFRLGSLYLRRGQLGPAQEQLERAARLDERDPGIRYVLARVYQRMGKTDLARAEFEATSQLRGTAKP